MALITVDDYPAVRAALDIRLAESELTDETISLNIYQGAAEREVIGVISDAQAKVDAGGDDARRVKAATVYLTAARLIYAVMPHSSLSHAGQSISYSRSVASMQEREAELRNMAAREFEQMGVDVDDLAVVTVYDIDYTTDPYAAATDITTANEWSRVNS